MSKLRAQRYTKPAELLAAVNEWAAGLVPWATSTRTIEKLKAIRSIPGIDRRLESQAKNIHDDLMAALNSAHAFAAKTPRAPRGYVYLVQQLTSDLAPRGFDSLSSALHSLNQRATTLKKMMTSSPSKEVVALRHFVQEVGRPWPAPDTNQGFRFEKGAWRKHKDHELTLDELVALAILGGNLDKRRASDLIGQTKGRGGATVADGVDALRKPMRKHILALTRRDQK